MRFVSLGLCTVLALGCGDGDQSTIDPNFLNPGSGSGSDRGGSNSGSQGGAKQPDVGKPSPDDHGMATQPELSACGEATSAACSMEDPDSNAASTDGEVSAAGGSGAAGSDEGSAGAGASSGTAGSDSAGNGTSPGKGGSAGSGSAGNAAGGSGGDGSGNEGGAAGGGEPEPLPDLILDGAYLMATVQQDFVDASSDQCLFNEGCVTGDGLRRVVRFGTRSANVGTADVIVGEPVAGNPLWEFDVCHEHFHFEGYARYDLVDAGSGEVLPIGNKNGFCLRDLDNWSNPSCATYDCDYQGISVGCADVYTPDLDCQWVDITDVTPGTYELVVTVNTERSIRELSFENNSARITLEIEPETVRIVP